MEAAFGSKTSEVAYVTVFNNHKNPSQKKQPADFFLENITVTSKTMASSFQDLEIPAKEASSITTIDNKQMISKTEVVDTFEVANTSEPRRKNSRDTFHESSWLFHRDPFNGLFNNPHITV